MNSFASMGKISKIEDNIFLSGVIPMEQDSQIIKRQGITHILCCVDKEYVSDVHQRVMLDHPNVTILYLPYNDDHNQNLWKKNEKLVNISSSLLSANNREQLKNALLQYNDKPLIDVGYHFIDTALQNRSNKVLVHCMAGISRSVSLVVYFKMKKRNTPYADAFESVRSIRPIAQPNSCFKEQLLSYDKNRESFTERHADEIIQSNR